MPNVRHPALARRCYTTPKEIAGSACLSRNCSPLAQANTPPPPVRCVGRAGSLVDKVTSFAGGTVCRQLILFGRCLVSFLHSPVMLLVVNHCTGITQSTIVPARHVYMTMQLMGIAPATTGISLYILNVPAVANEPCPC